MENKFDLKRANRILKLNEKDIKKITKRISDPLKYDLHYEKLYDDAKELLAMYNDLLAMYIDINRRGKDGK